MFTQSLNRLVAQLFGRVSLQKVLCVPYLRRASLNQLLIVPFVLQICTAVGLTGYLSFRSGQQAVEELANRLMSEAGDRVELYLDNYLKTPHLCFPAGDPKRSVCGAWGGQRGGGCHWPWLMK